MTAQRHWHRPAVLGAPGPATQAGPGGDLGGALDRDGSADDLERYSVDEHAIHLDGPAVHPARGPIAPADAGPTAPAIAALTSPLDQPVVSVGRWSIVGRRLLRSRAAVTGLVMLALVTVYALVGNVPNRWSATRLDLLAVGSPPSRDHWFGTTAEGSDLYAQLVHATGRSLLVAAVVGLGAPAIAAVYGTTIASLGGIRDGIGLWVLDLLLVLPSFLFIAVAVGGSGGSLAVLVLVLVLTTWMAIARVVRAQALTIRDSDFVRAARYAGVSGPRIVLRHIVPNLGGYLVLQVVLAAFGAIMSETGLSYVGIGVGPGDVTIGSLLAESASQVDAYPWLFWGPTLVIVWITAALALLGDGLRDALDPTSGAAR